MIYRWAPSYRYADDTVLLVETKGKNTASLGEIDKKGPIKCKYGCQEEKKNTRC